MFLLRHMALISVYMIIQRQIMVSNGLVSFIQLGSSQGTTAVPVHRVLGRAAKSA